VKKDLKKVNVKLRVVRSAKLGRQELETSVTGPRTVEGNFR
jgi:hypothetical protein